MKALAILFLSLVMILTGCGVKNGEDETTKTTSRSKQQVSSKSKEVSLDKKYDIHALGWGQQNIGQDDEVIKYLNEKLNINFNFEIVFGKEYIENLELRISANDMPDMFRYIETSQYIYRNLYEDGYLSNFTEYANKYNLTNILNWFEVEGVKEFSEPEGFFQLPTNSVPKGAIGFLLYREDWMEKLNLDKPKDYDEFKEMLKTVKESNISEGSIVPLTGVGTYRLIQLIYGFHATNEWKEIDGKFVPIYGLPGLQEGLKYLRDLYKEGLIDQEIFTINETQARGKFVSGNAFMVMPYGYTWDRYMQYRDLLNEANPNAKTAILDPMPEGPEGIVCMGRNGLAGPVLVPQKDEEEYISRTMALLDYMHSEEGKDILLNGVKGIHYTISDGKKTLTDVGQRDLIPGLGHLAFQFTDYTGSKLNVEKAIDESYEIASQYAIFNPYLDIYETPVIKEYKPLVNDVYQQWIIDFIIGKKDLDEDWEEYLQELKNAGLDKVTEEVNEVLKNR